MRNDSGGGSAKGTARSRHGTYGMVPAAAIRSILGVKTDLTIQQQNRFDASAKGHPRVRVVFNQTKNLFTIYADKRLQSRDVILEIAKISGIEKRKYVIKSDSHYVETPFY